MGWLLLFALVVAIIGGILKGLSNAKKEEARGEELNNVLNGIEGFTLTKKIVGHKNLYVFAIDDNTEQVLIHTALSHKIVSFSDIISVEISEDNKMISKKSTMRTFGGAVLGGVIAGGTGAIIGGLSGSSSEDKRVSKIQVGILLRDISNPRINIDCFDSCTMTEGKSERVEGYIYKICTDHANDIKDTISVIIDKVDAKEKASTPSTSNAPISSIVDQLEKLHSLKEKGILTEKEFTDQKAKLLS